MKEQAKTPVFQEDNGTWAHLTKLVNPFICTIEYGRRTGFSSQEEAEEALQIKITVVNEDGASFVHAVVDDTILENHKRRQIYEQADCSNCGTT